MLYIMPKGRYSRSGGQRRSKKGSKSARQKSKLQSQKLLPPLSSPVMGTQFPMRIRTKLPYVSIINHTATATPVERVWRGCSLFDPDLTGAGHQAMGHDQWSTIYQRYSVKSTKLSVTVYNTSSTNYVQLFMYANTTSGAITGTWNSNEDLSEADGVISRNVPPYNSAAVKTYSIYRSTRQMHYPAKDDFAESADISSNPTFDYYFHTVLSSLDETTVLGCRVKYKLTYYVEYSEPQIYGRS